MRGALPLAAFLLLTGCDLFARFDAPPPMPLVQADYPVCVTISPGPIKRPDGYYVNPYRNRGGNA